MKNVLIKFLSALLNYKVLFILSLFLIATTQDTYAAEVIITNNLNNQAEGKKIIIDDVEINLKPKIRYKITLYPGDTKEIAAGSITKFTLNRIFPTHKIKYVVSCKNTDQVVKLTVENIHDNKMGNICNLERFGHWSKRSGLKWSDI